jgi:hypothetical protein
MSYVVFGLRLLPDAREPCTVPLSVAVPVTIAREAVVEPRVTR